MVATHELFRAAGVVTGRRRQAGQGAVRQAVEPPCRPKARTAHNVILTSCRTAGAACRRCSSAASSCTTRCSWPPAWAACRQTCRVAGRPPLLLLKRAADRGRARPTARRRRRRRRAAVVKCGGMRRPGLVPRLVGLLAPLALCVGGQPGAGGWLEGAQEAVGCAREAGLHASGRAQQECQRCAVWKRAPAGRQSRLLERGGGTLRAASSGRRDAAQFGLPDASRRARIPAVHPCAVGRCLQLEGQAGQGARHPLCLLSARVTTCGEEAHAANGGARSPCAAHAGSHPRGADSEHVCALGGWGDSSLACRQALRRDGTVARTHCGILGAENRGRLPDKPPSPRTPTSWPRCRCRLHPLSSMAWWQCCDFLDTVGTHRRAPRGTQQGWPPPPDRPPTRAPLGPRRAEAAPPPDTCTLSLHPLPAGVFSRGG